ncbi:MAG: 2-oxo acid dehydrogenase subunit E2 [Spirochaetales bacterium]|nr:2-oxo acid dehydrogenase subunit E2 [Spirochaetales bacterium]
MADKILKDVITPDLGSDHAVPIAEIFVSPGDEVKKEDPLLSLESEKAVMDLPAPFDGVVAEILVEDEQEIETGMVIMRLDVSGADAGGTEEIPSPEPAQNSFPSEPELPPMEPTVPDTPPTPAVSSPASPSPSQGKPGPSHASPSVRLYARELGVDLSRLTGTGPKNRVRREDVQNFVKNLAAGGGSPGAGTGSGLPPLPFVDPARFGSVREEKLTGIQKISAAHLHASWVNIPHVTHYEKADITDLERWRKSLNSQASGTRKYTTLAFVVKALTAALKEFPRFNGVLAPEGDRILLREYFNVGIAVDTPRGLLVPVIRETDKKGIGEIADEIIALAGKGREGRIKPDELQGGSITITNLGGIGGTAFTPIINPPEVAILGLSRAAMEPVWKGESFEPRLMLPLSLSYDHRVIDGALAAAFAARLAGYIEDLRNTLI